MDVFLFSQFSPAPCSPPLGGSIADSAVRFTPAVKYGGREYMLSRRETRCIRGHPCRAHHKLKWARKMQSVLGVLYELLSRSESGHTLSQLYKPTAIHANSQTQAGIAFAKVAAQATGQEPGSRTQRRCAHNHNSQAKERNRGSKPLSKNVNPRSQSNNERPRPNKAIAWSKQGSKATISMAAS